LLRPTLRRFAPDRFFLMPDDKKAVRKRTLRAREELGTEVAQELSGRILRHLKELELFRNAKVIHTYVSTKPNEVDTRRLIQEVLRSGRRVAVPITNRLRKALDHSEILGLEDLKPGTFGILEPATPRPVDEALLDLVIVPVVAVDRHGNRVGFGGGYYDRFLKGVHCPKVALAYSFQVLEEIPSAPGDERVDFIVTEDGVVKCS